MRKKILTIIMCFIAMNPIWSMADEQAVTEKQMDNMIKEIIDNKYKNMKSRLQSEYKDQNWSVLLNKKETMDTFLLPVILLEELADTNNLDYCRLLTFNYDKDKYTYKSAMKPEMQAKVKNALSAYSLENGRSVSFKLKMAQYPYVGNEYPVLLSTTGDVSKKGATIKVDWYEPYLANREMNFPIHPEKFFIKWNPEEIILQIKENEKSAHIEKKGERRPIFNNPHYIYGIFDALRLKFYYSDNIIKLENYNPADIDDSDSASVCLIKEDDSLVKKTEFVLDKDNLKQINIRHEPVTLLHQLGGSYTLQHNIEGKIKEEIFKPTSKLLHLKNGRDINIDFEEVSNDGNNYFAPKRMSIHRNGLKLFEANFDYISYANDATEKIYRLNNKETKEAFGRLHKVYLALNEHDLSWTPTYYTKEELSSVDTTVLRPRLKYNIYAAIQVGNWVKLYENLEQYKSLLDNENIRSDVFIYNLEAITQLAFEFTNPDNACIMACQFLKTAYDNCDTQQLITHTSRLIDQFRFGYALIAMEVLQNRKDIPPQIKSWIPNARAKLRELINMETGSYKYPDYPYAAKQAKTSSIIEKTLFESNSPKEKEVKNDIN
jgi:hypothetical protein